jgi:hypothetical protein
MTSILLALQIAVAASPPHPYPDTTRRGVE